MDIVKFCRRFKAFFAYTGTWIGLFPIYKYFWGGATFSYFWFLAVITAGYVFVIVFQVSFESRLQKAWSAIWITSFICAMAQILGHLTMTGYGDQGQIAGLLINGVIWPRWLGGSAILTYMYKAWAAVPILGGKAGDPASVTAFIKLLGSAIIILISMFALNRWPKRLSVSLSLATPVYLMFSTGYDEYYPFIAGIFLVFLLYIFEGESAGQDAYITGIFLAALVIVYFPFLIISLICLAYFWVFRGSSKWKLLSAFLLTYILCIFLFWPIHSDSYVSGLMYTLNTGERNTIFPRYVGQSAGSGSIFFHLRYVLSWEHMGDLLYMFFWSGNMPLVFLLLACLYYLFKTGLWQKLRSPQSLLLTTLFLWQCVYFVFMLPKLGPRRDIDLFFTFYIYLAFTTGYVMDFVKSHANIGDKIDEILIPAAIANALVALFFLVGVGIPDIV